RPERVPDLFRQVQPVAVAGDDDRGRRLVDDPVDAPRAVLVHDGVLAHRHPRVGVHLATADPLHATTVPRVRIGHDSGVRASRLVTLLFTLQRLREATAAELARELEVSERTIYRDVAALSAAGVPLWPEPGRGGGIRLLDGWRTRLDGLTAQEAAAIFAVGAPQVLAELGMSAALAGAQAKLLATLPEGLREHARTVGERF